MLKRFILDSWFCKETAANYGLEIKKYCRIIPETMEIILGLYIESPEVLQKEKNSMLHDTCFFDSIVCMLRDSATVETKANLLNWRNMIFPLYKRRPIKFFPVWYYIRKDIKTKPCVVVHGLASYVTNKDLGVIEKDCFQYYNFDDSRYIRNDSLYKWKLDLLKRIAFGTRRTLKWNKRVVDI